MDSVSVPAIAASVAVMVLGGGAPLAAALILNWRDRVSAKGADQ